MGVAIVDGCFLGVEVTYCYVWDFQLRPYLCREMNSMAIRTSPPGGRKLDSSAGPKEDPPLLLASMNIALPFLQSLPTFAESNILLFSAPASLIFFQFFDSSIIVAIHTLWSSTDSSAALVYSVLFTPFFREMMLCRNCGSVLTVWYKMSRNANLHSKEVKGCNQATLQLCFY